MKGGDKGVVGNIEKRGENSYRLRVSGGYTGEGKKIIYKKTVQAKNKNEARKELALFISEIETGQALSAKKMRFRDYADFWINNYAIPNLSPKTSPRLNPVKIVKRIMTRNFNSLLSNALINAIVCTSS